MWASAKGCLRKVTSIILVTTALLWVLLNVPVRSDEDMAAAAPAPLEALRGRDGARRRRRRCGGIRAGGGADGVGSRGWTGRALGR